MKIKGNLKTYLIIVALVTAVAITSVLINISKVKQGVIVGEATRVGLTDVPEIIESFSRLPTRVTEIVRCTNKAGTTKVKLEIDKIRLDKIRLKGIDKVRSSLFGEEMFQCKTNKDELLQITLSKNWRESGDLTPKSIKLLSSVPKRERLG